MEPDNIRLLKTTLRALALALSITGVCTAQSTPPDLTASGAIAALKTNGSATPTYANTFNLGPTGLRGWIHCFFSGFDYAASGRISDASRQILVTVASTPATNPDVNGNSLAVDDVILGAIAADSGTVPSFTSDARKALGTAITNAEKTGAGTLRVKRWRAGITTEVNITIPTLGTYSATAPYNCPKSLAILTNTRNQMVGELIANSNYLGSGHSGAINALALLASVPYVVVPGDPNESNYSMARTRLQTYARSLSVPSFQWANQDDATWIWHPAYQLIFLSEYYLLTNDSLVIPTINGITLWLAEFQSMFGTFGHGPGGLLQDESGRRFASGYGPVNACGNVANLAIVLGKKALLAASQPIDPKINTAIQRGTGFLGSYVNKGGIPYGEHMPGLGHASNGKDASAAVFFGLQADRAVETEYFSRMSIAGWVGVDVGHAGQELGLLWAALGAGMGGDSAASGHFKQLLWRFDLTRRTNGSFTYDSGQSDYYGGGTTAGGTYLGNSAQHGVKGTAIYLLAYSLPLKQLHITGKQANPAYTLDSTKIANSVSAGYFRVDRANLSVSQLFTALGDGDPVVRYYASLELAAETLSSTELTNLRGLLASPDANVRQSAAETLGIRKDATALPTLVGMLNGPNRDPDHWVRQKVTAAIRNYNASTVSSHRDALINAFIANAPADPDVIDWADPLQFSRSALSDVLFNQLAAYTINAPKETHLYPALRAGLLLPTGYYRGPVAAFARDRLNLTDLQNLFPELVEAVSSDTPADRMFSGGCRADALAFMVENNISEGVEIAFAMFNDPNGFPWGSGTYLVQALNALVSYGDAARYTLPRLREVQTFWNTRLWDGGLPHGQLKDTITFLENVTSDPPATNLGKCVANPQIVTTTGAQAITLTGASPRGAFSFQKLTDPANGTLIANTTSNFTYTPNPGFTGTDKFTFQTEDSLTTSEPATVAIIVGSSGTGIAGAYFDNADFTGPVLPRTDPQINFDWGTGSPDPSIGADTFSTRWSGYLLAPETGTYSLSSLTSDGVRAYLNGVPVINNLNDQSTRWTDGQSISLTAGQKVPLLVEYYENTGSAVAKLKWSGPSFAGLNGNIIPQAYLFDSNSSGGPDTTAPVISTLSPADNATGVAHAADLVATFSENIVRGTGNITIKNLSDRTETVIPVTDTAQVAIAGATLIIHPTALLAGSKNHAVQIDATAIDDTAGLSFAGIKNDTTWNFTTTAPDTIKPTPNPMSFAVPPQTGGSTSITMTATTASDPSGVEYRFNNITLGTSSPWQNSPAYTATGLAPSTDYTFTVQARDKSAAGNTTTASAPASARTLGTGPLDVMRLNFYAFGSFSQDAVTLEAGESAGIGAFHVSGWQNYQIPWGLGSPAAPITLTSSVGSTATMRLNDVRNGGTYSELPHPLFAGGDGDLMNAQCHGTEDPYNQSALFNMDVSNIPYQSYDLIVYMGANSVHGGDRTGKVVLNGGAERDFTLTLGFSGFTEITNATTPGNYIVFRGLTNPSLNLKVWGNGFNHLGPTGFQIVNYGAITGDTLPPVISTLNPADEATGVFMGANLVATFSEPIARGTGNITIKNLTDSTQTTVAVTDTAQVSISGAVLTINPTANFAANKNYAIQIEATCIADTPGNSFAGITNDTTWNFTTSNINVTPPPVTDGMIVWLPADGVNTSDTNQVRIVGSDTFVKQWNDWSTAANKHASNTTEADQPRYVVGALNGKPVLRFGQDSEDNGDRLFLGDLSANFPTGASLFVVATIDNDGRYNLFGNRAGSVNERWVANTWNESRPGSFRTNRSTSSNFTFGDWPQTGSHVFALESDSTEFEVLINGGSIGADSGNYNSGAGISWTIGNRATSGQQLRGDIAEVILYDRVLNSGEANQVGAYLAQKYALSTSYGPVISTYSPADNTTGVAVDANLVATFSKPIAIGTGDITVKNLSDATQTTIAVTDTTQVSISGAVLTINPAVDLLSGRNYAILIAGTAIDDTSGKSFAGITTDTTWNFATAAPATTTIAVVSSSGSPSIYGDSVTFTATVDPVPSGGTVQFYSGIDFVGTPVPVNTTTGLATVTTTTLGATTHDITAEYSGNFQFVASTSTPAFTQTVNKAPLTVTAQNVFRYPNTANPDPLPYEITGFQNGENLGTSGLTGTPALSTTAVLSSPVGPYPITCAVGDLTAANYSFKTFVDATLTVVVEGPLAINVNFTGGTAETQSALSGPAGGLGTTWNQFTGPDSPSTLVHSSGPATTVTIDTNFDLPGTYDSAVISLPMLRGSMTNFGKNENATVTISGLESGGLYDIWLVSLRNQGFDGDGTEQYYGTWSTTNATSSSSSQLLDAVDPIINTTTFVAGYNYVLFEDVVATTGGVIVFTSEPGDLGVVSALGNRLGLNGLQIQEVAPVTGFNSWASANGATDQTPQQDHDNDGVRNGIEFFMGETGSSFTANPSLNASNTISWRASAAYQGTYEVQTSPDLVNWTNVVPKPVPTVGTLSYTLPTGAPGGKSFVRLLVTPTP